MVVQHITQHIVHSYIYIYIYTHIHIVDWVMCCTHNNEIFKKDRYIWISMRFFDITYAL